MLPKRARRDKGVQGMGISKIAYGSILLACSTAAAASSEKNAVKAVMKAVKVGGDLVSTFPAAISSKEAASLQRVAKCSALNLMKQKGGHWTVVWDCGSKGALGMRVEVTGGQVTSISTMAIGSGPDR
jgi:hypothetical protein